MPFNELQDPAQAFHLEMYPYSMFKQLFTLIRHEIDQGIRAEAQHPITGQPVQKCADAENNRAQGQYGLNYEYSRETGKPDRMIQHGGEPASVNFLFSGQLGFQHQPVAEEGMRTQLFHESLSCCPDPCFRRLREEP